MSFWLFRARACVVSILAAAAVSAAASAQPVRSPADEQPVPSPAEELGQQRPSIGLVLSGGGARGGAHIGVLRALEELRVPIDYIAGTSIGAVVGGFYVSGMSVQDLEDLVEGIEWEEALFSVTPRQLRSFRRKRDDDLFLVDQSPGLNDGEFELPIGFVQGQVIDTILSRETLLASRVDDFDDLAVPFRAVATDIVTGEPVVLSEGSLPRALRASMSIPAALAPIEIDGRLLVDGGISMNLPVEVAQNLGADVLIAIDITSQLLDRETLRSVLDVTSQLTNFITSSNAEDQRALLRQDDLLIAPVFPPELTSGAFTRMAEAIQSGYDAVMQHRETLAQYALDEASYHVYVSTRRNPRMESLPVVDFIRIDNDSPIANSVIETRLAPIEIGAPLDVEDVERAMNSVYGLEYFQNARYSLVRGEDDTMGLEVELDERTWGPNYLQLGMSYSSAGNQDALFGLAASYLRTAVTDLGAEWRATFVVGDEPALIADRYQPIGPRGVYFLAPSLNLSSRQFNVFVDDERVTEAQLREYTLEFAVGREFPSWGEYRFGVRAGAGDTKLRVGDPTYLPEDDFHLGEVFGRFSVDTLDAVAFPRSGGLATIEYRAARDDAFGADATFDQLVLNAVRAKTWGRHTVLGTLRYDQTVSGTASVGRLFRMGGFLDLSGLNHDQLSGQHAARLGVSYYRRIGDLALFPAFAGVSVELGNVWQSRSDISMENSILGGSFWAGVSTPVGPVYVGYGVAEGGDDAFYVYLGRVF